MNLAAIINLTVAPQRNSKNKNKKTKNSLNTPIHREITAVRYGVPICLSTRRIRR
jgi:hypothetical protein